MSDPVKPFLTVALSTLGRKRESILCLMEDLANQSVGDCELLVVLQTEDDTTVKAIEEAAQAYSAGLVTRIVVSRTRGLMKSRNIALAEAKGELILYADDDCRYPSNAVEAIMKSARDDPGWDVMTFLSERSAGTPRKPKMAMKRSPFRHGVLSCMHVSSIEIVMRSGLRQRVKGRPIWDERFGLGTDFPTGGENIMLADLYRAGIVAGFIPEVIVRHSERSGRAGQAGSRRLALSKGAMFRRMFGWFGLPLTVVFVVRHMFPGRRSIGFDSKDLLSAIKGFFQAPR